MSEHDIEIEEIKEITFPSIVLPNGTVVEPTAKHTPYGWMVGVFHHNPEVIGMHNIIRVVPEQLIGVGTSHADRFCAGMGLLVNTTSYVRGIMSDDDPRTGGVPVPAN